MATARHGDVEPNPGLRLDQQAGVHARQLSGPFPESVQDLNLNLSSRQPARPHARSCATTGLQPSTGELHLLYFNARCILTKHTELG